MRYLKGTFKPRNQRLTVGSVIRRTLLCIVTLVIMATLVLFSSLFVIFKSDCGPLKKEVIKKTESSVVTKWIPSLYLSDEEITALMGGISK